MDEHLRIDSLRGARRLAVWESARAVARSTTWSEVPARGAATAWALLPLGSSALSLALVRVARKRRERQARSPAPVAPAALDKGRLPQIDASRCLGCHACVDACPFAVLEVQRFVAVVARPADCCGVVACAEVCPNGSLSITGEPIAARRPRLGARALRASTLPAYSWRVT
jgi:ferredoxin